jgi:predicted secreted protein
MSQSEALRNKSQHLQAIHTLANQFGAKIVDVSENSVIVELAAKTSRVEAFLALVKPFGILEAARTGGFYVSHSKARQSSHLEQVSWPCRERRLRLSTATTTLLQRKLLWMPVCFLRVKGSSLPTMPTMVPDKNDTLFTTQFSVCYYTYMTVRLVKLDSIPRLSPH